jgi:hypothetical protein
MNMLFLLVALSIVASLAFYAGSLLFKLRRQQQVRHQKTQQRIDTKRQDIQREELEAQLESQILNDVAVLKTFNL